MDKYIITYIDEEREGIFRELTSEEAKKVIDFCLVIRGLQIRCWIKWRNCA